MKQCRLQAPVVGSEGTIDGRLCVTANHFSHLAQLLGGEGQAGQQLLGQRLLDGLVHRQVLQGDARLHADVGDALRSRTLASDDGQPL